MAPGFGIPRIVFTYLDYLLADRKGQLDFQFTFRNSVEHFYPQHPDDEIKRAYGALSDPAARELLGNLALVTVRDNSKFTNNPPYLKAEAFRVVAQSPKLGKMAEVAQRDNRAWDSAAIHAHKRTCSTCSARTSSSPIDRRVRMHFMGHWPITLLDCWSGGVCSSVRWPQIAVVAVLVSAPADRAKERQAPLPALHSTCPESHR